MCLGMISIVLILVAVAAFDSDDQLQTDEIIEAVNAAKTTWKAGRNFHPSLKKSYVKNLFGVTKKPSERTPALINIEDYEVGNLLVPELPKNFDAREKWKFCTSLQQVRDQGSCGSCWAVSTAAAFTDRLCIATNGTFNGHLSAQHLLTCCYECGSGCRGGSPEAAWLYFYENGIVSGGDFESGEGCQPYTFPECEHYVSGPKNVCRDDYKFLQTPSCLNECYNKDMNVSLEKDLHAVQYIFRATASEFVPVKSNLFLNVVQNEIYQNGPLTTTFTVFQDFLAYKSGVYQHTVGDYVYGHAVKVIGWGTEGDVPYWLVANSWNSDWGENGLFKIARGHNECGFEEEFYGGKPNA